MKRILLVTLITVACCGVIFGQTPTPTATPSADETDVVKITTALIQLDVTVTDKKGKIVTDLRPEEVEVYENGQKQKITNFSFISNIRSAEVVSDKRTGPPVVIPPTPLRAEKIRRTIALVVDDLTLSFESTYYVRRALKKFVDEQMQEGDLVAIIRTGAGIGALQQFTNDKRQLYAAIERVRWNPVGNGNIGAFAPLESKLPTGGSAEEEASARLAEESRREFNEFRESVFATGTLGAVNYVVRGMQDLPGRKSILLLSDGFKLFEEDASGMRETGRVMDGLRRLVDMANRASVVIYTMDARGLQYTGLTAADNTGGWSQEQMQQASTDRNDQLLDTQDGLRFLARQTGGTAIINTNDLSGGIRKILDDQSYYLLAYEPEDATFDPRTRRFNTLQIKISRPGTLVRYRSGFFGVSDEKIVRPPQTPERRLMEALTSPFSVNELPIKLNALFYNTVKTGNIIRSLVHVSAQDLSFTDEPSGEKKAVFDVIGVGFGDNGVVVDQISKTYTLILTKEAFAQVMKKGFVYNFSFPVKKAGAYQLRVALHDHGSDKLGSANQFVEVPNLKKGRLLLSGVVLENLPYSEWQKREAGQKIEASNPLNDTSLRQFKRGTVLNYGFTIYNSKAVGAPNLSYRTRIFRDGKSIYDSPVQPVVAMPSEDPGTVGFSAALALGTTMLPGDYVLQVTIIDNAAKQSRNTTTQFVTFEIVD